MLNRVVLIGRMTRDPELRKTASGLSVASFSIAVDDIRKGPNGEKNTLFMNCSIFGVKGENVVKYTRKGSLVAVEGRLNQRTYTSRTDNQQRTVVEVIADNCEFLDPKGYNGGGMAAGGNAKQPSAPATSPDASKDKTQDSGNLDSIDVVDDDLPF